MANFLLVHGAWMDARCWNRVIELLQAAGHDAVAFDLAGHGLDATPLADITLDRYCEQTISEAEAVGDEVILVGHSMAGIVISQSAEKRPDLFKKSIYVAAYLPKSGQSLNDLAQTDADSHVGPAMRPAPDWSTLDLSEESRGEMFFHDVTEDDASVFLEGWKAEPVGPQATPLSLSEEKFGSVSRLYVSTANDRVVSPGLQTRMIQSTPTEVVTIETGHVPMLANPEALVAILQGAVS